MLIFVVGNHDYLHCAFQVMDDCGSIGRGEDAELFRDARKGFQGLLCFLPITRVAGVVMHSQESNRRHRISRRCGGILQRLAACCQHAKALAVSRRFAVKKTSGGCVVEARDHRIGNCLREFEVAEVRGRLICVETGEHRECIVLEHPGYLAMRSRRIGVGNHM